MFLALKQSLKNINGWKWAALFLFEFVVVLLGVLAAQMLQERFQAQQQKASFEANRIALNRQLDNVGTGFIQRGLQTQCVVKNLRRIVATVEAGRALPEGVFTTHPPKGAGELTVWDSELAAQTRKYLDDQDAGTYEFLGLIAGDLRSAAQREESDWATLALANNNVSQLGDAGRTQVLLAANNLLHAYEGWERAPATVAGLMQRVGARPDPNQIRAVHPEGALCRGPVLKGLEALNLPAPDGGN